MEKTSKIMSRDCALNNTTCTPMTVWERNRLAVEFVMNMHRRGVTEFPRRIDHNWSFGWTLFVVWGYRNKLVRRGIEPTSELLLEMLYLLTDERGMPFGAEPPEEAEEAEEETAPITDDLGVFFKNGKLLVCSKTIAAVFGKLHKNVLRDIQGLDCSRKFNELNFEPVDYTDSKGEKRPEYHITRDGFAFLVMGYTGKKAAQFKEAYINKFNEMEAELRAQEAADQSLPIPALLHANTCVKPANSKKFYVPEEAAEELGLRGYRTLYIRMEALGMVTRQGKKGILPVTEFSKYVRLKAMGTKKGNKYRRIVVTPSGLDYLRTKL